MKNKKYFVVMAVAALNIFVCTVAAQAPTTFGVGTGTNTPEGTLHIHSSVPFDPVVPVDPDNRDQIFDFNYNTVFRFTNGNTGIASTDGFTLTQANYNMVMDNREKGYIRLKTLGGSVYLSEQGRFGIGDTAINHRFNVDGTSRLGGNTDVVGNIVATGSGSFSGGITVGNSFSVLANGDVSANSITLGTGMSASSSGILQVGNDIAVGLIHISSVYGIFCGNGFQLTTNGIMTLNGGLNVGGNIVTNGSLRVGSGFYCDAQGNAKVKELRVTLTDWPDFVFGEDYRLAPLTEVEEYISENGHLPQMPSAAEVEADGADLGEMNKLLLQKVEELTLYIIDLQKQLDEMKSNK